MINSRVLATVRDYDQLLGALRAWMVELNVAGETVDYVAGLPLRYTGKLFAPVPIKGIGRISLGPLLGALGLKLIVAVDQEALDRVRHRLEPRKSTRTKILAHRRILIFEGRPDIARIFAHKRTLALTPRRRREIAKNAIAARWAKRRA